MARVGHVIEKKGDHVTITTSRRGVCEGCSEKSNCSFDPALGGAKPENVIVKDPIGTNVGDMVEFDLAGHTELRVSLIVWIFPLIGVIIGAILGFMAHDAISLSRDIGTLLGAILGFAVSFGLVMAYEKYFANPAKLIPVIQKIITGSDCQIHNEDSE